MENMNISQFRFIRIFAVCIFVFISMLTDHSTAQTNDTKLIVKVGVYENKPKIFTDENGNVAGFWYELIEHIAKKENWDVRYVHGTWNENLERLKDNRINIMPDVAYTQKRAQIYKFSAFSVLMSWSRVYVSKTNSLIQSITDLKNKKIAVLEGSVNFIGSDGIKEIVDNFNIDCTFIEFDNYDKAFRAVEDGLADACVTNRNYGDKNDDKFNLKKTAIVFQPISMKFAFTKDGPQTQILSEKLDYQLKKLINDNNSIYYQLLERYFESEIAEKTVEIFPKWIKTTLKSVGFLLIFLLLVIYISRIQVKRKTYEIEIKNREIGKSEAQLRTLLETIPDLVWLKDPDGKYISCNKKFERFFGAKEADIIGKTDYDFVDTELADFFREKDKAAIASNGPNVNLEEVTFADDGHTELLETVKTPMYDTDDNLIGVLGIARDITRIKQSEKEIRQEKEFTETALNSQRDTFFLFEPATGKAIRWNHAFNKITGYTDDEIARMKAPESYFSPEDTKKAIPFIEKVNRTGFGTIELNLICKDGRRIPTEYNVSTMNDDSGLPRYFISIGRDLTERKQLELRFQHLAETSSDWIWEFDENSIFTYSSPGVTKLLGYTPDEVIGKSAFDLIPSPEKEKVAEEFSKSKDLHEPFTGLENINQHKDGHLVTIDSSGTPIFDSEGEFKGYRGIDRDISERKQMEEELRQSHKMESIGTLAGGIAHDFNNILGIILGNSELVLNKLPVDNPFYDKIQKIRIASLRAKDVVRQLLSFSRRTEQSQKPTDIASVINESINLIRSSIPSNIEIDANVPTSINTILADSTQIHQVIINLCTNASHAMQEAGGVLTISLRTVDLQNGEQVSASNKFVELVVKDTGSGINPANRNKIFDPYFTTKEIGKGTGMGLAVVHGIVKSHNGQIFVDSVRGKGTRVSILFPVIDAPPQKVPLAIETAKERAGNETILFIDDEKPLAEVARDVLTALNYKVEVCTNPVSALAVFSKDPDRFDIVITDMTMPKMNGVELAQKLRDIQPDVPIIVFTGNRSLIDEKQAKEAGVSAIAMKPISMHKLAKLISSQLTS